MIPRCEVGCGTLLTAHSMSFVHSVSAHLRVRGVQSGDGHLESLVPEVRSQSASHTNENVSSFIPKILRNSTHPQLQTHIPPTFPMAVNAGLPSALFFPLPRPISETKGNSHAGKATTNRSCAGCCRSPIITIIVIIIVIIYIYTYIYIYIYILPFSSPE